MAQHDKAPGTTPKPKSMGAAAQSLSKAAKRTAAETYKSAANRDPKRAK